MYKKISLSLLFVVAYINAMSSQEPSTTLTYPSVVGYMYAVQLGKNGDTIFTPDGNGVCIKDRKNNVLRRLECDAEGVRSLRCDHQGKKIAAGSNNAIVSAWDIATGSRVQTFKGCGDSIIEGLSWDETGRYICTTPYVDMGPSVVCDMRTGKVCYENDAVKLNVAAIDPKAERIFVGYEWREPAPEIGRVTVHDIITGQAQVELIACPTKADVRGIEFTPNGEYVVFGTSADISLWDAKNYNIHATLANGIASDWPNFAFNDDATLLAFTSKDRGVQLVTVPDLKPVAKLSGSKDLTQQIAWQANVIAQVCDKTKTVQLWDLNS